MAPKSDAKKTTPAKKAEAETTRTAPQEAAQEAPSTNAVMNRLSQQFNLLTILIVALFLFQAYTFYQVKDIQTNGTVSGAGGQQDSPLSEDNLLAYAEEIGLDKKQYEQCMADEATAAVVTGDMEDAANFGVQGTPGFFINGRFLGGAFPIETFREIIDAELAGTATGNCEDYSEELQQYCADPETAAFKPEAVDVAVGNAPQTAPNAPVTIIEYSDFECPFCARAYTTVNQIKSEYGDQVNIVYKHLPLTNIHPNAQRAAEATVCAQKQGKFWEMHDKLFEVQGV